jgi:type II secretory pathway pseudopilin PulG
MTLLQYNQSFPGGLPTWQSYTSATLDQKQRILAYAMVNQQFPQYTSASNAKLLSNYMQGWNNELQLNLLAQTYAQSQGMGTQFAQANAIVEAAWNKPNGISDADDVNNLLWITFLSRLGVGFSTIQGIPPAQ